MRDITYDNITDVVLNAYAGTKDKRKRELGIVSLPDILRVVFGEVKV